MRRRESELGQSTELSRRSSCHSSSSNNFRATRSARLDSPKSQSSSRSRVSNEAEFRDKFSGLLPRYVAVCERFTQHVDLGDPELHSLNSQLVRAYQSGQTNQTLYTLGKMNLHNMISIIQARDDCCLERAEDLHISRFETGTAKGRCSSHQKPGQGLPRATPPHRANCSCFEA